MKHLLLFHQHRGMMVDGDLNTQSMNNTSNTSRFLHSLGYRYWAASLLPALAGTLLPFWLQPRNFSFKLLGAVEFLLATLFFHAGFSLLLTRSKERPVVSSLRLRLVMYGLACIIMGCLLGLHMNSQLVLHGGVVEGIFLIYGASTLFVGLLYVIPPFCFFKRVGGEVILSVGLGMIPVLGAYIVQVGDLTRTVYLASLPIVAATGLRVWISELISRNDDEKDGYHTMVMIFPPIVSGRYIPFILTLVMYLTLVAAVIVRHSLPPTSLITLLSLGIAWMIISRVWKNYANIPAIRDLYKHTKLLHHTICIIMIMSLLV